MRKLLLDTNIILDIALPGRPDHASALVLLGEFEASQASCCFCATSVKDVYCLLCKYLPEQDVRKFLKALTNLSEVLPIDSTVCQLALDSDEPDVEDGMIRACAELARVDFIITRDAGAFKSSPVRHMSAKEYVDIFVKPEEIEFRAVAQPSSDFRRAPIN